MNETVASRLLAGRQYIRGVRMGTARIPESREQSISRVFNNLRKIVKVLYTYSRCVERSAELTPPQSWLISVLAKSEPAMVSELARNMHLHPATVIRILDRLETSLE